MSDFIKTLFPRFFKRKPRQWSGHYVKSYWPGQDYLEELTVEEYDAYLRGRLNFPFGFWVL